MVYIESNSVPTAENISEFILQVLISKVISPLFHGTFVFHYILTSYFISAEKRNQEIHSGFNNQQFIRSCFVRTRKMYLNKLNMILVEVTIVIVF